MPDRAVFLDRDGVLNAAIIRDGKPYPPAQVSEFRIIEGAEEACSMLKRDGFRLIVVTNQPDVARGSQQRDVVEAMNRICREQLPIDDVMVCWHDDKDHCACRKPKPGLLIEAAEKYGIDLAESYMIGDRWRDIDAGASAGCATVWIDCGYTERGSSSPPTARVSSIREAATWIASRVSRPRTPSEG